MSKVNSVERYPTHSNRKMCLFANNRTTSSALNSQMLSSHTDFCVRAIERKVRDTTTTTKMDERLFSPLHYFGLSWRSGKCRKETMENCYAISGILRLHDQLNSSKGANVVHRYEIEKFNWKISSQLIDQEQNACDSWMNIQQVSARLFS